MKKIIYLFLLIGTINSCKVYHNQPLNQTPNEEIEPNISKLFVDQNGSFYPDDWLNNYGPHPKNANRYAYSLRKIADNKDLEENLKNYENDLLSDVKEDIKKKERLIILVHGYNNGENKAKNSFKQIEKLIGYNSSQDQYIEFYWDGLVSDNPIGSAKIWFKAAGYSQLAGEYGLRKILNLSENKEIVIISHSRGASVVLSSLSNPPYPPSFAEKTAEYHLFQVNNPISLEENNNEIKVIMLAPAIGRIDFKTPNYYENEDSYRSFTDQLKLIHITVNSSDKVLKKYVGDVSDKFNPTNLGYDIDEFKKLSQEYDFLKMTNFTGQNSHSFSVYVSNPKFEEILKEDNIIE